MRTRDASRYRRSRRTDGIKLAGPLCLIGVRNNSTNRPFVVVCPSGGNEAPAALQQQPSGHGRPAGQASPKRPRSDHDHHDHRTSSAPVALRPFQPPRHPSDCLRKKQKSQQLRGGRPRRCPARHRSATSGLASVPRNDRGRNVPTERNQRPS